jgi:hypothetical protein
MPDLDHQVSMFRVRVRLKPCRHRCCLYDWTVNYQLDIAMTQKRSGLAA